MGERHDPAVHGGACDPLHLLLADLAIDLVAARQQRAIIHHTGLVVGFEIEPLDAFGRRLEQLQHRRQTGDADEIVVGTGRIGLAPAGRTLRRAARGTASGSVRGAGLAHNALRALFSAVVTRWAHVQQCLTQTISGGAAMKFTIPCVAALVALVGRAGQRRGGRQVRRLRRRQDPLHRPRQGRAARPAAWRHLEPRELDQDRRRRQPGEGFPRHRL